MREVSSIDHKWLIEVAPHFYEDNKYKQIEAKRSKELADQNKYENERTKKVKMEPSSALPNTVTTKNNPTANQSTKPKKSNFVISDMDYMDG